MTAPGKPAQPGTLELEFDLPHPPQKVWRALCDPALLSQWLLPAFDFKAERDVRFTLKTQAFPGWDGTVACRVLEVEEHRRLRFSWDVPFLQTIVTLTLTPTATGTRLAVVQSGFKEDQQREFGGARYGWGIMGQRLGEVLSALP